MAARLADGNVLASWGKTSIPYDGNGFQLYRPAEGEGRWVPVKHSGVNRPDNYPAVLTITALGKAGRALVGYRSNGTNQFFPMHLLDLKNPDTHTDDVWEPILSDYWRTDYYGVALIEGTEEQCGVNCGKVLVVSGANDSHKRQPNDAVLQYSAELYDTDAKPPTAVLTSPMPGSTFNGKAVSLLDGRVLATGGTGNNPFTPGEEAYLYDPKANTWSRAADAPRDLRYTETVRLADGRVLVTPTELAENSKYNGPVMFDPADGEIDPVTGRSMGSWSKVEPCPQSENYPPDTDKGVAKTYCQQPTLLADGTVLTIDLPTNWPATDGWGDTYVFDPAKFDAGESPWTYVGNSHNPLYALTSLVGTRAQCGVNCGKVLGTGSGRYEDGSVWSGGKPSAPGAAELYTPAQAVEFTGLFPGAGFACGGRQVTISGRGLETATGISFGEAVVAVDPKENVNTDGTAITVEAPAHLPGRVDVSVVAAGRVFRPPGMSFTYNAVPDPSVASLSLKRGPVSGGTRVNIGGRFAPECVRSVSFGEVPAASYKVGEATPGEPAATIAAVSPRHPPGGVRVRVTVDSGPQPPPSSSPVPTLPTLPPLPTDPPPPQPEDVFTYHPVISSIEPVSGPTTGGTEVTILGDGFAGATEAGFGDGAGRITQRSETRLVAVAPAHEIAEAVGVQVVAAGVPSLEEVLFTYEAPTVAIDPGGDKDLGTGPPKHDASTLNPAPPGGSTGPAPGGSPAPGPSPTPGVSPVPGSSPAPFGSAVGFPTPSGVPGHAGSSAQAPSQTAGAAGMAGAATAPAPGGPAAAPAQAAPGSGGAPGSGQAGVGGDEERGEVRHAPRHNMTAANLALGLGAAGAAMCFSGLALGRRRRSAPSRPRPRPHGAY